jgi:hypothetical protein
MGVHGIPDEHHSAAIQRGTGGRYAVREHPQVRASCSALALRPIVVGIRAA